MTELKKDISSSVHPAPDESPLGLDCAFRLTPFPSRLRSLSFIRNRVGERGIGDGGHGSIVSVGLSPMSRLTVTPFKARMKRRVASGRESSGDGRYRPPGARHDATRTAMK
jgi:hypothetical protein